MLRVHCAANRRDEFLLRDAQVWTPALAAHDGFISKEVFVSRDDPTLVTFIIRWESLEQWKSFPLDELQRLDARLADVQTSCECETYDCPEALRTNCGDSAARAGAATAPSVTWHGRDDHRRHAPAQD
jgi:uncharacterized protein (TIGR03792 family)